MNKAAFVLLPILCGLLLPGCVSFQSESMNKSIKEWTAKDCLSSKYLSKYVFAEEYDASLSEQRKVANQVASDESGSHYFEFIDQNYKGMVFFLKFKDDPQITDSLKTGTGVLSPALSVDSDMKPSPDWQRTKQIHDSLSKLGLKLLPFSETKSFDDTNEWDFRGEAIYDAFKDKVSYVIMPDMQFAFGRWRINQSKRSKGTTRIENMISLQSKSELAILPIKFFNGSNKGIMKCEIFHSFCAVENIGNTRMRFSGKDDAYFKKYFDYKYKIPKGTKEDNIIDAESWQEVQTAYKYDIEHGLRDKEKRDAHLISFCESTLRKMGIGADKYEKKKDEGAVVINQPASNSAKIVDVASSEPAIKTATQKTGAAPVAAEKTTIDREVVPSPKESEVLNDKQENKKAIPEVKGKKDSMNTTDTRDAVASKKNVLENQNLKVKVLSGTGKMLSAKKMLKRLTNAGYRVTLIDKASRSDFHGNTVYYAVNYQKEAGQMAVQLGGNTTVKPLTWESEFHIIVVTGK